MTYGPSSGVVGGVVDLKCGLGGITAVSNVFVNEASLLGGRFLAFHVMSLARWWPVLERASLRSSTDSTQMRIPARPPNGTSARPPGSPGLPVSVVIPHPQGVLVLCVSLLGSFYQVARS